MPRTLIVGFDGATPELCSRFMDEGRMPELSAVVADGVFGPMRSTLPSNSAVAWTSLSTGVNPGRHGIFDFTLPRRGAYGYRVTTRDDRRVPALWDHASAAGARVAVVNIPMTFPAGPVNGVLVAGMDAPLLDERAVSPPDFLRRLRKLSPGYRIVSKAHHRATQGDFEAAERELTEVIEARAQLVAELARPRDFDLVMVNLEATDGAHHFFWEFFDPAHPRHDPARSPGSADTIGRVYEATDRQLGRIVDAYQPDTVLVVSDHGGGPSSDWVVFMNDWLAGAGFLHVTPGRATSVGRRLYERAKRQLSVPVRRRLRPLLGPALERAKGAALYGDVDWSSSRAYALMQADARLNLRGREPNGVVSADEAPAVLAEMAARATELRRPDGKPVFVAAHPAPEVYDGDAPGGPDLVLELAPGTHVRGRNNSSAPGAIRRLSDIGTYLPSGLHTRTGIVAAAGRGISSDGTVAETDILQVAPSVLAVAGVPAPPMEAPPFSFVTLVQSSTGPAATGSGMVVTELSRTEEDEVLERLRGLGYVD